MKKTIAWVIYRLDNLGGGERLLFEGARYYRSLGHRVIIITWAFDKAVLFDGLYDEMDIVDLGAQILPRSQIVNVAWSRAKFLLKLRSILKSENVSLVFCQGEYDVALVYLSTLISKVRYRFLIFGQMFQYPHDMAKYSLIFRRHLARIVASCEGYRDTVSLQAPPMKLLNRLVNEVVSVVRWFAVRKAERTFSFSRQVQWETNQLFGVKPIIAKGAYRAELCERQDFAPVPFAKYSVPEGKYILSLSRLDRKKRIDVIIRAFAFAELPEYRLLIGGKGEHEQGLRQIVAEFGLQDRVYFLGLVDECDLMTIKHHCELFVSMDIGDFDISPLEALAVGAPVLCPTEFELDDVLDRNPAVRISSARESDVAIAMTEMVAAAPRPDRRKLLAYSWERYFDQLLADTDVA